MAALPPSSLQLLRETRAVFTNGFVFDELPLEVVQVACREAIQGGAAVFFDPGRAGQRVEVAVSNPNLSLIPTKATSSAACIQRLKIESVGCSSLRPP